MFNGIDHVVIAVKDIEASIERYEAIYGTPVSDRSQSEAAGMQMAFFRFEHSYVELVTNLGDAGPIAKRLNEQGEGIHLVAMKVDDLEATVADLRTKNIRLIGDPGEGNPVKGQVFLHPSVTGGVLTQLVER
ncbi:MAG: VOC family protein [Dehalococcoidia bacterium]|nr:VOC family protein [Dehalococcoidia bacterium]